MSFDSITAFLGIPVVEIALRVVLAVILWLLAGIIRRRLPSIIAFFVRWAFRALTRFMPQANHLDESLITAFLPAFQVVIDVLGLWLALLVLNLPATIEIVITQLRDILMTIAAFWIAQRLIKVAADQARSYPQRGEVLSNSALTYGQQLAQAILWIVALVVVAGQLGYNASAILAGLGLGGLAVALAAQDLITNLIGYFVIIVDAPFNVGDYIITDKGSGFVEVISFRTTRLRSLDRPLLIVPNKDITSIPITNWSRASTLIGSNSRIYNQVIYLALDTPPEKVLVVVDGIRTLLLDHKQSRKESILVFLLEIGEHALNIQINCEFTVPAWNDYQVLQQEINLGILGVLNQYDVSLSAH